MVLKFNYYVHTFNPYSIVYLFEQDIPDFFSMQHASKHSVCMSWNGRKIKTFDGITYNSTLYCSHTLAQDSKDGSFDVILKTCPIGAHQPCPYVLTVLLENSIYTFENFHGTLKALSGRMELPIPTNINGVDIKLLGVNVQIFLEIIDLEILWDGNQLVALKASPSLYKRTQGLCGPFDGNMRNDIKSKTGRDMIVGTSFLEEWRKPMFDDTSDVCVDNKPLASCVGNVLNNAHSVCSDLYEVRNFEICIDGQDEDDLIESCIDDYCNCNDQTNPEKCACDGLLAIAKSCQMQEIELENGWREQSICGKSEVALSHH